MVSEKETRTIVRHYFDSWNKGKAALMDAVDQLFAIDSVFHSSAGRDVSGLNDLKQFQSPLYDAFPDVHFTLDDLIVEGDKAVLRYTFTGMFRGAFMGALPTNRKVTMWGIEIDRIVDGKIVEAWGRFDTLSLMQQLGAIPTPKK
jgi:steroid delta-isomerase-like uncharacterized protein